MWMLLLPLGCSDYDLNGKENAPPGRTEATAPAIAVDPVAIDFGALPIGGTSDAAVVTLTNIGDAPLGLDGIELVDASAPFTLTAPDSALLDPGAVTSFTVTFRPDVGGDVTTSAIVHSNDPDHPGVPVSLTGGGLAGNLVIDPVIHDFGVLEYGATASVPVTISNTGDAAITVDSIAYRTASTDLSLEASANGPPPWRLEPAASMVVTVNYAPTDDAPDEGTIDVLSDDPDEPTLGATQYGNARPWEGFSTGWYIVDDGTNYETTSNPSYTVESHGDLDGYWYEPSGAHGLIGSADPVADFAVLHDYVIARAGAPTPVTGPLTFRTSSTVPSLTYASYSYVLCDFWLDASDDPARYTITSGQVDDGILVLVNGEILGNLVLGSSGTWPLDNAIPGAVNSLVVILMDNAAVDKYLLDLAFYRDGVMVTGP